MAGIYIHIPFCKKFCNYCDFYKVTLLGLKDAYIKALQKEIELRKDYVYDPIETIYFGGGTPSLLSYDDLHGIIDEINTLFSVSGNVESTIEVNPDDISKKYLSSLKKLRFNRISMGIQSWNNRDLKLMNRRHNVEQAEKALNEIIDSFDNVSVDLIYGIPGMSVQEWEDNIDKTLNFNIQHISAYSLTVEPGTAFAKMKESGKIEEADEESVLKQYDILVEKCKEHGFVHYEISNFAKPGRFSVHNSNYWKQVPYVGFGSAAHSFNGYSRQWNVSDVKGYISELQNGIVPFEKEDLSIKTRFNEYIMTSLRTMWGIDLDYVEMAFDKEMHDYVISISDKYKKYGMMVQKDGHLILTDQGMLISDNIISDFLLVD